MSFLSRPSARATVALVVTATAGVFATIAGTDALSSRMAAVEIAQQELTDTSITRDSVAADLDLTKVSLAEYRALIAEQGAAFVSTEGFLK